MRQLTDEGSRMWSNLTAYVEADKNKEDLQPKKLEIDPYKIEHDYLRLEIRKMIENSKMVIQDCNNIIIACLTKEEYYASEARIAKTIHTNLIGRLQRILDGQGNFDSIVLKHEDQGVAVNNLYIDTFKNR